MCYLCIPFVDTEGEDPTNTPSELLESPFC